MNRILTALLVVSMAAPAPAQDQPPPKVKKIVLYKHGVGYFEREGSVTGNAAITLNFKSGQMKDLLKSLYAVDLDNGRIGSIMYDSKDPLAKQLENFAISVPDGNALTAFLANIKGAEIEAKIGPDTITGQIVGIEPVVKKVDGAVLNSYKLVVYRSDGALQPFDLLEVTSLKLKDETLQKDLKRVLDIYGKTKRADQKLVTINTTGEGVHHVRVGYIVETPIWKTSYRLLFDETDKPLLQGWGIVENTTDEDWEDIEVTFVAGSPMSFVMDLYTAYYPARPEISLATVAGTPLSGAIYALESDHNESEDAEFKKDVDKYAGGAGGGRMRNGPAPAPAPAMSRLMEESVSAATVGAQLGDMFTYTSKEKVSIARGRSALVPILSERLSGGSRVLHWRPGRGANPYNSYWFQNSTKLTLEAGPVTFFDGSTCVGEGLSTRILKKGMHDLVAYAVETSVKVQSAPTNQSGPVTRGRLVNGLMIFTHGETLETKYTITNDGEKEHTIYLDHPKAGGFELKSAKPEEDVDNVYRYKIAAKKGKTEHVVNEHRLVNTSVYLLQTPAETIRMYLRAPYLSAAAKAFLEDVIGTMGKIDAEKARAARLAAERTTLNEDFERTQKLLDVLKDNVDEHAMRKAALEKITAYQTRIDEIRKELGDCAKKQAELNAELAKKVQEFKED